MFNKSAFYYDLIYSHKDYRNEANIILNIIKEINPGAKNILDIACGTSEHHKYLKHSFVIDGLDINPNFINISREKNLECHYYSCDMSDFNLEKKYDVIICLFSSISYLKTLEKLENTFKCFIRHLNKKGIVIIEPWFTEGEWKQSQIYQHTYEKEELKISRMTLSGKSGKLSTLNFHFLIGNNDKIEYFEELHELTLFNKSDYQNVFSKLGLSYKYDEYGLTGRGLYFVTL